MLRAAPAPSLTNLAHLDFLSDQVAVQNTVAHSTYRLDQEPEVGVLWVYADAKPDGSFSRVGGGPYDAATNTYAQGAFDADDIARAAVVYLRQWRATGDPQAKEQAYQQLRGLGYLQTLTGPTAGEVVLWMQPDGSLNPSPTPVELPNPSDSGRFLLAGPHSVGIRRGLCGLPENRSRICRLPEGPNGPGGHRTAARCARRLPRLPDHPRCASAQLG